MTVEIEKLHDLITNVRLDIRELNTKMDDIKDLTKKVEEVQSASNEALQSTRSAHKRLDKMDDNQTWLWRTVIGAIIAAVVGLIIKYKGGA